MSHNHLRFLIQGNFSIVNKISKLDKTQFKLSIIKIKIFFPANLMEFRAVEPFLNN